MSRRLRVLVALATVAAMLLSLAGFASAQFSDVDADADYADAVELLAELKVAQGYPDGTFGVNNNMTRQEFAAFVVRAMGREAMAQSFSNARTAFRDDAEIAPWARGYVYVATQARIINGYPDGTFRPNGQVTQAEAITMIVRALGFSAYAEKLGAWPTGYLLAAGELGVSDGLTVVAGLPMTRGEMAIALKNALAASYRYNANTNELDRVDNGENSWLRKAHGFSISRWREVAGDVTKVAGEFKRVRSGGRIELANGAIYELADTVEVLINDGDNGGSGWDVSDLEEGDRVTLTLNDDDEVTEIAAIRFNRDGVIDGVGLDEDEEEYGKIDVDGVTWTVDADTVITLDGDAAVLADLEDLVDKAFARVASFDLAGTANTRAVEIEVFSNTVRGKVERLGRDSGGRYVILDVDGDDEKYHVADGVTVSLGMSATFILDNEDVIVATANVSAATDEYFAILVGETSNNYVFERGDGTEFQTPKSSNSEWTLPSGGPLSVGTVYHVDESGGLPKVISAVGAARYTGTLLTRTDSYIRVQGASQPRRLPLADDVIVKIGSDPFKSVSDLRTNITVSVWIIEHEGEEFAAYIEQ